VHVFFLLGCGGTASDVIDAVSGKAAEDRKLAEAARSKAEAEADALREAELRRQAEASAAAKQKADAEAAARAAAEAKSASDAAWCREFTASLGTFADSVPLRQTVTCMHETATILSASTQVMASSCDGPGSADALLTSTVRWSGMMQNYQTDFKVELRIRGNTGSVRMNLIRDTATVNAQQGCYTADWSDFPIDQSKLGE
jgi:multidrug efflux pump subunit AcrA (membrane-fusion protein)